MDFEVAMLLPVAASTAMIRSPVPRVRLADYLRSDEPRARLDQTGKKSVHDRLGPADACFETESGSRKASEN